MYKRNPQSTILFSEQRLDLYLKTLETSLKAKIDRYNDNNLLNLNAQNEIDRLIEELQLYVPKLITEKTTTSIIQEKIEGHQLPSGTRFSPGKLYEIEIANYSIPISGNPNFFKYVPKGCKSMEINAEIKNKIILFKFTEFSKITGNDEVIKRCKEAFLQNLEIVDKYLVAIKNEVEDFITKVREELVSYLTQKKDNAKLKDESKDKLNPFK